MELRAAAIRDCEILSAAWTSATKGPPKLLTCSGDDTVNIWNPEDCRGPTKTISDDGTDSLLDVTFIAAHPSKEFAVTSTFGGLISVIKYQHPYIFTPDLPHRGYQLKFNHNGDTLAVAGGASGLVMLLDTRSWECKRSLKLPVDPGEMQPKAQCVAWSPEEKGQLACGYDDGRIAAFDVATGSFLHYIHHCFRNPVSILYSPVDPKVLFSAGDNSKCISIHDAEGNKNAVWVMHGHRDSIKCLDASTTYIASGSIDGTVRLWDLRTSAPLKEMTGHEDMVSAVAFRPPKGLELASVSHDGNIFFNQIVI